MTPTNTIIINSSSSKCFACGYGADPNEKKHEYIYEYTRDSGTKPGCGIEWKYAMSDYWWLGMKAAIERQWPHLIWIGRND